MKQVNRKFLEEQVKKCLKEQIQEPELLSRMDPVQSAAYDSSRGQIKLGLNFIEFIVNLPYGSAESYVDFKTWLEETGMYGIGSQKYYKKIADTMVDLNNPGGRAPWNHLMMRFARNAPGGVDAKYGALESLNLTFKEDLAEALVNVRDKGIQRINSIPEDGKSINKVEVALIETVQELSEVADDFGFTSSDGDSLEWPWGKQIKMPRLFKNTGITDILDPASLVLKGLKGVGILDPAKGMGLKDTGIYEDFAKDMIQTKDLKKEMEEFLMFHFVGLEGADFEKAYNRMRLNSDLPRVSRAVAAYNAWNQQGLKALAGIVDITLSTATTAAFMLSLMSGIATPAAPAIAAGGVAAKQAILQSLKLSFKKLPNKVSSLGVKALESKKFGSTVKALDGLLVQFSGFAAASVVSKFEDVLDWWRGDLVELNEEFKENYKDKSPEDRVAFYNDKILPTVTSLAREHSKLFKSIDTKLDQNYITTAIVDLSYLKKLYKEYSIEEIKNYQSQVYKATNDLNQTISSIPFLQNSKKLKNLVNQKLRADKTADKIAKKEKVMDMPKAIQAKPKAAAAVQKVEPADQEIAFENILFVGDSIAVGMAVYGAGTGWKEEFSTITDKPKRHHAKGIKTAKVGDHAETILRKLEAHFDRQSVTGIKEQAENTKPKIMIISTGTNDALSHAKGQPTKTAEEVVKIIEKTVELGKQNGYQIRLMPLMPYTGKDTYDDVILDRQKHQKFIDKVNSSDVMKKHGFDNFGIQMAEDGVHPTAAGYKLLYSKALGTDPVQAIAAPTVQSKKVASPSLAKAKKPSAKAIEYFPLVKKFSKEEGINPQIIMGIINTESRFNPNAKSNKGAEGLMQLMPSVQKEYGVTNAFDPEQNIRAGIKAFKNIKNKLIPYEMKRVETKFSYESLTDQQKLRLGLYGFNWGARGLVTKLKMNTFNTIEDFFAKVNSWYLSNNRSDYANKVLQYANSQGGSFDLLSSSPSVKKLTAQEPQKVQQKENIKDLINNIAKSDDYDTFRSAFYSLFDMTPTTAKLAYSDIIAARDYLSKQDLSTFTKRMIEYLKSQHKINSISWKRQYKEAVKSNDPDAEKLMAFFHRPIFFVSIFSRGLRKILGSSRVSFGFEPNNRRVSVNPDGKSVFYKQDYQGNQKFNEFLSNLDELKKVLNLVSEKVAMAYKTDPDKREQIRSIDRYVRVLSEIVNDVSDTLKDRGESAIRKAYSIAALDLAARTVK